MDPVVCEAREDEFESVQMWRDERRNFVLEKVHMHTVSA